MRSPVPTGLSGRSCSVASPVAPSPATSVRMAPLIAGRVSIAACAALLVLPALLLLTAGCDHDPYRPEISFSDDLNTMIRKLLGPSPRQKAAMMADPNDPDRRREGVRMSSREDWGRTGKFPEIYALMLEKDYDPTVRAEAARALGRVGEPNQAPTLIRALDADRSDTVRWAAARALDRVIAPEAVAPLIRHARGDDVVDVRAASAEALRHYPRREVFDALVDCLDDESFTVRHRARDSLIALTGEQRGYEPGDWAGVDVSDLQAPTAEPEYPWWDWMKVTDPS